MFLQVHKDGTDAPTLVDEANYFVGEKENRKQLFGNFFCERYPKQVPYLGQSQHKRQIRDQNKRYQRQISWCDMYQEVPKPNNTFYLTMSEP